MVKVGDKVNVDGVATSVTGTWGAGKHRNYQLADGRIAMDLSDECVVSNSPTQGPRGLRFDRKVEPTLDDED